MRAGLCGFVTSFAQFLIQTQKFSNILESELLHWHIPRQSRQTGNLTPARAEPPRTVIGMADRPAAVQVRNLPVHKLSVTRTPGQTGTLD